MNTRNSSGCVFAYVFAILLCCPQFARSAPCDLLTQNQLSTVVGASFAAGSPISTSGCSSKATGASKVIVTVSMQNEKIFNGAKGSTAPMATKTAVSGIGDEAIFIGSENFSSLWIKKGATYLLVRIYGVPLKEA